MKDAEDVTRDALGGGVEGNGMNEHQVSWYFCPRARGDMGEGENNCKKETESLKGGGVQKYS